MIGKEERLAKNDLHFSSNVKRLRMFLMPVQLETRCKCLTTFCYRLYPSVLKTAGASSSGGRSFPPTVGLDIVWSH